MEDKKIAIRADQITKIYKLYEKPSDRMKEALGLTRKKLHKEHYALQGVDMTIYQGETVGIIGSTGSGKTTLLSLIAGLDVPLSGRITVNGADIAVLDRDKYRRETIGMVFQSYYLLPQLTAAENILLSAEINKRKKKPNVNQLLETVGLTSFHGKKRATQLSGGEQQRIAIARAIAAEPTIILADEPTGNLDNENSKVIITLLRRLAHEQGKCVIVVTHSEEIAAEADIRYHMSDGVLRPYENQT